LCDRVASAENRSVIDEQRKTEFEDGVLYLNEEAEGLKGAKGKRPFLGAEAYVRRWMGYHPTGEPGDYLITPKATGGGEPGGMITQDTIRYHLRKIADNAEVDKDVHPHIFRHYFTTIAKRDYDMDDAYVKHLRGDSPGSNVMETTYRHLSDDDAKSAEEQIQADVKQDYAETDPGDEQQDKIDTLDELLDDPEVKAALLERMDDD